MSKTHGHNKSTPDPIRVVWKMERKARPAGRLRRLIEIEMDETAPDTVAA